MIALVLPRDGLVQIDARAVPDLLLGERQVEAVGRPLSLAEKYGRDEDPPPVVEETGVDNEIPHSPALVVEQEIGDGAEVAICRGQRVPFEIFQASQHRSLLLQMSLASVGGGQLVSDGSRGC